MSQKELATAPPAYTPQESFQSPPSYGESLYGPPSAASAQLPDSFYGPPSASNAHAASPPASPSAYHPPAAPTPAPYIEPTPQPALQPLEVDLVPTQTSGAMASPPLHTAAFSTAIVTQKPTISLAGDSGTDGLLIPSVANLVTVGAMAGGVFGLMASVELGACRSYSTQMNVIYFPAIVCALYAVFCLIFLIFGTIAINCSSSRCWYKNGPKNVWYTFTSIFVVLAIISGAVGMAMLFKVDKCYDSGGNGFLIGQLVIFSLLILTGVCAFIGMLVAYNSDSGEYWYANIFVFQWLCFIAACLALVFAVLLAAPKRRR